MKTNQCKLKIKEKHENHQNPKTERESTLINLLHKYFMRFGQCKLISYYLICGKIIFFMNKVSFL
jgi:DNA-directed RNA polymerase subunit L